MNKENLQLKYEIKILKDKYHSLLFKHKHQTNNMQNIINRETEIRVKEIKAEYDAKIKEYNSIIEDKDAQIMALKRELAKKEAILNNNSSNSGIPTSKTPIGQNKYIPNTREKSDKKIGGQKGHKKHKLERFNETEATEIKEIKLNECPNCKSSKNQVLESSIDKCEIDYDVKLIKRINRFKECKCKDCGCVYHAPIPNDLKEDCQYGKGIQSLALCLTNEIYTPFNKTVKLVSGITNGEINLSEGYVAKLQKRAYNLLDSFDAKLEAHFPTLPIYYWDDTVISVNGKGACMRVYCNGDVALYRAHTYKNKEGIDADNILNATSSSTIVMHDHVLVNYNDEYSYENAECVCHLLRRIKKVKEMTKHEWQDKLINLLSETIHKRNMHINNNTYFNEQEINDIKIGYDNIIDFGVGEFENSKLQYLDEQEMTLLKDIKKYKKNYLLWLDNKELDTTNNISERSLRSIKSKMKISGQFKNIENAQYHARIKSYIETAKRNEINIITACVRLMEGNPYTLEEMINSKKSVENN